MGTLFSAIHIARSGLFASQVQLDITGHNIANVNRPGFSRQRANLTAFPPEMRYFGAMGRGVQVGDVQRIRDIFLDQVLRQQAPGLGEAERTAVYYQRIEDVFLEPGDDGLSAQLSRFFDALNAFANNVESGPSRTALLSQAQSLCEGFNNAAVRLQTIRENANEEVRALVPEINSLASRIADLNKAIAAAETGGKTANDLRDDRDLLLDQLASLTDIQYHEREDGRVDVLLGDEQLVSGNTARALEAVQDPSIDPTFPGLLVVQFADNGDQVTVRGGELAAALKTRDEIVPAIQDRMDTMARSLILEMNKIHSQGNSIVNFSQALLATNGVSDPLLALNDAGVPFEVQDGSFDLVVYDSSGAIVETITVNVNASGPPGTETTLEDIRAAIDAGANVNATIDSEGRLQITPDTGFSFAFANDSAGALPALGLNGFFSGHDARTMDVSQHLLDDPNLVSSGFSLDVTATGDNAAALAMAALRDMKILENGTQTAGDYYQTTVVNLGIQAQANLNDLQVERAFLLDFEQRRQEVSGVNLDEEVANLVQYQRAYEASARVINIADRMLETLMSIAG